MKPVAVVILNWNGQKFLEKFLPNVVSHSVTDISDVFIIDNASTDSSIQYLNDFFPEIRTIMLDKNYGFAGGYNKGLAQIQADYYVLLNSDVEVTNQWIFPLYNHMQSNKTVAVCMPKIKSFHQKEYFEYAGAAGGFLDIYGFPFCKGRLFDSIEKDEGQYDSSYEIFWSSGAAMFVRSSVYTELGGLDHDFFAHMEEIDFCWRAKNYGYSIMYIPESEVFHVGGGTLPQSNPFKTYLNFRNNLFLLYKNLPSKKLQYTVFIRKIFDGIACVKFLFSGQWGDCKAVIKAHIDYYASVKNLRAKRKKLNHTLSTVSYAQLYKHSIVWEYFIRKKNKITL
ncbi:MAG TPA: glycosyltransferase family 2 protein [Bacteroidales bacterium]|nr:MAG: N-acetylglucosaminyl-diphospho-decaprenol L-rhamnosyltransferase [Bacteroidetes bacterium ADurb.Bin217]HPM12752.1 glycosyltransferase family 2 protein [Bacteroidales bacterium]